MVENRRSEIGFLGRLRLARSPQIGKSRFEVGRLLADNGALRFEQLAYRRYSCGVLGSEFRHHEINRGKRISQTATVYGFMVSNTVAALVYSFKLRGNVRTRAVQRC